MKKLLVILMVVLSVQSARAENILGVGYQYGVFHLGNINRTVYAYNYTRQWLTQSMAYFHTMPGVQVHYSHVKEFWGLEFNVNTMGQTNEAYGIETSSGLEAHRKIKMGLFCWGAGASVILKRTEHLMLGFSLTFDHMRLSGTTEYSNPLESEYMRVIVEKCWSNSIRVNLGWFPIERVGLTLRPFVMLPYRKANTEGLMYYLQGDYNTQRTSVWNYGCTLNLTFRFGYIEF